MSLYSSLMSIKTSPLVCVEGLVAAGLGSPEMHGEVRAEVLVIFFAFALIEAQAQTGTCKWPREV
jgi:hypothetical protein